MQWCSRGRAPAAVPSRPTGGCPVCTTLVCSANSSPLPLAPAKKKISQSNNKKTPKAKNPSSTPFPLARAHTQLRAAVTRRDVRVADDPPPATPRPGERSASADWAGLGGTCRRPGRYHRRGRSGRDGGGRASRAVLPHLRRVPGVAVDGVGHVLSGGQWEAGRCLSAARWPRPPPVRAAGVGCPVPAFLRWGRPLCGLPAWALGGSSHGGRGLNFCRGRSLISS